MGMVNNLKNAARYNFFGCTLLHLLNLFTTFAPTFQTLQAHMVKVSKADIRTTLTLIELRLQLPSMSNPANAALKEGYMEAKRVLEQEDEELEHIAANCESIQARCIAWQAVDYLQGEIEAAQLLQYQPKITARQ